MLNFLSIMLNTLSLKARAKAVALLLTYFSPSMVGWPDRFCRIVFLIENFWKSTEISNIFFIIIQKWFYSWILIKIPFFQCSCAIKHPLTSTLLKCCKGAVHKVCHAPGGGGLRKCDSLWQGEGGKDHVMSHFQFFSQFTIMSHFWTKSWQANIEKNGDCVKSLYYILNHNKRPYSMGVSNKPWNTLTSLTFYNSEVKLGVSKICDSLWQG